MGIRKWRDRSGQFGRDVHGLASEMVQPEAFFNMDSTEALRFPGFAGETTKWLLEERKIRGVGIDTHGADPGLDTQYSTNIAVTKVKGVVLENLTNLDRMPATGATIVIGVPRLANGSGTPVAVTAFLP